MRKVFLNDKFEGDALSIQKSEKKLIFTFAGDFPGMAKRNIVIPNGKVIYEDDSRIYAAY